MNIGKDLTPTSTQPATVHVPLATEDVRAIDIEAQAQALYNYCKSLYDGKIVVASGVTMLVGTSGAITCNGTMTLNGTGARKTIIAQEDVEISDIDDLTAREVVVTESLLMGTTGELTVPTNGNAAFLGRTQGRPRVYMANVATVTIDTTQADEFVLGDYPTLSNVIVLRTTTAPIPREDETITLLAHAFYQGSYGPGYSIKREDGTVICTIVSPGGIASAMAVTVQCRFSSGAWRLGPSSGGHLYFDEVTTDYFRVGVVAGAGA